MFHYATLPRSYFYSPALLDPRDRYLAALASAKAAEAEYLTAEATQREEDLLRRRLVELQHRKLFQPRYDYAPGPNYDTYLSNNLFAELSRQVEMEEHLGLVALQKAELAERRRREEAARQLEKVRLRRAHEKTLRFLEEREQARYTTLLIQPAKVVQPHPICGNKFSRQSHHQRATSAVNPLYQAFETEVTAPTNHNNDILDLFVQQLLDGIPSDAAVKPNDIPSPWRNNPCTSTSASKPITVESKPALPKPEPTVAHQGIFEHFLPFLGPPAPRSTHSSSLPAISDEFERLLADEFSKVFDHSPVKPTTSASTARASSSSEVSQSAEKSPVKATQTLADINPNQSATVTLKEQLDARLNNELHSEVRDTIQAIFASLQNAESKGSTYSTSDSLASAPDNKEASNGGSSSNPVKLAGDTPSLKEQLEARLNNEFYVEARDTIQAIFASLHDTNVSGQSVPSSSSDKGKAKAENSPTTFHNDKSVANSLNQVRTIESAFHALESDFTFPLTLDFITTHLASSPSPSSSDSENSGATTHLAYTARNHPVRFYEQALGALLTQLDSIESFGNESLRATRKEVVDLVERALESLEREVEGRWRARVAKEAKKAPSPAPSAAEQEPEDQAAPSAPSYSTPEYESTAETNLTHAQASHPIEAEVAAAVPALDQELSSTTSPESSASPSDSISHDAATDTEITLSSDAPTYADKFPPSLSASSITVKGYDASVNAEDMAAVASPASESGEPTATEAFLLASGDDSEAVPKRPNYKDSEDAASDWSEVEA